ncbi:uncharacterized protein DS421_13g432600 [Arachis hypogaea]|nr:uncharacterized protein DS421_13g432600 [Arachis hypogaea]
MEARSGRALSQAGPSHKEERRGSRGSLQAHEIHGRVGEEAQQTGAVLPHLEIGPGRVQQQQQQGGGCSESTARDSDPTLLGVSLGSKVFSEASEPLPDYAASPHGGRRQGVRQGVHAAATVRHKNLLLKEPEKPGGVPGGTAEQGILRGLRNGGVHEERVQPGAEPSGEVRVEHGVVQDGTGADMGGGSEQRHKALQLGIQQVLRQEDERDSGDAGLEQSVAGGVVAGLLWRFKERVDGSPSCQLGAPKLVHTQSGQGCEVRVVIHGRHGR